MAKLIIATYDEKGLIDVFGEAKTRFNGKMNATLASVALKMGVPKTRQGKQLSLRLVDGDFDQLTNTDEKDSLFKILAGRNVEINLVMDYDQVVKSLHSVNAKPEYQGGMKPDVYKAYQADLVDAYVQHTTKVSEVKKAVVVNEYGLKVGDYLLDYLSHRSGVTNAVVTKVTDKGYETQSWVPTRNLRRHPKREGSDMMGSIKLPLADYEELFRLTPPKKHRFTQRFQEKPIVNGDYGFGLYSESWDCYN